MKVLTQIPTEFLTGCPGTWAPSVQMPVGKEVEAKSYNREGTYGIGKDPNNFAVCEINNNKKHSSEEGLSDQGSVPRNEGEGI